MTQGKLLDSPFTISFALRTNVVTKHCAQNEILFGSQLVKRLVDNLLDDVDAFFLAEKQVYRVFTHRLNHETDFLALEPLDNKILILFVGSVKHHLPNSFLVLIDVVQEYFQINGINV